MATGTSTGTCSFCGRSFGKSGIARHLKSCKDRAGGSERADGPTGRRSKMGRGFHVVVEGRPQSQYWMHLEVPAKLQLLELDSFLRGIWLECCGHLSAFTVGNTTYSSDSMGDFDDDMEIALGRLFLPGMRFRHEYDFGTTTELALKVVSEGEMAGRDIRVLARNDAPVLPCGECGSPAAETCMECSWGGNGLLCDECAAKHACGEEMFLPMVNSPRTGICDYSG